MVRVSLGVILLRVKRMIYTKQVKTRQRCIAYRHRGPFTRSAVFAELTRVTNRQTALCRNIPYLCLQQCLLCGLEGRRAKDLCTSVWRTTNPYSLQKQESCAIASMTSRCANKSKQTTSSHTSTEDHATLGWFNSTERYGRSCYGRRCWTNIFSPKFLHVPLGVGGRLLGYEERRCCANCLRN